MKSNQLFGHTRDVVKRLYALRTPSGFVTSCLPGWDRCTAIVHISPGMGAQFTQYEITLHEGGSGEANLDLFEMFVYVLEGSCSVQISGGKRTLNQGGYMYVPAETDYRFHSAKGARLLIFEKLFDPLNDDRLRVLTGDSNKVAGKPFMGNKDAVLQTLMPDGMEYDMAVNIFTYQPGATLPFVETHVMEHGLLMLSGQGIYRLDEDWHPVQAGDVIWMAQYCPQWFVAMGSEPASYIYYKDVNRLP